MRILPDGSTREAFAAIAMSPYRNSSKRLWRWPNVFSFSAANGMWKGRILPEVEEHLEATRIQGSAHLRTHSFLFENTGDAPVGDTKGKNRRKNRQGRTETGGDTQKDLKTETPNAGGETGYPLGKRLRMAEFEASKQHCPRGNKSGKPLCWNFNSNSGCATKGGECAFGLHRRMKGNGLHWTIQAQISRRGGFIGTKVLTAPEIDGFILSLRNADNAAWKAKKDPYPNSNNSTGGYTFIDKGETNPTDEENKENNSPLNNPTGLELFPPNYNIGLFQ